MYVSSSCACNAYYINLFIRRGLPVIAHDFSGHFPQHYVPTFYINRYVQKYID